MHRYTGYVGSLLFLLVAAYAGFAPDVACVESMVVERFKPGQVAEVYVRFRERGRMLPDGLEYVSSWVDVERTCCFQLMETDNRGLLDKWMENWKDLIDFEVFPAIPPAEMQRAIPEM